MIGETNPYNPFKFEVEFQVNVVDDEKFDNIKKSLKQQHNIPVDDILAVEVIILSFINTILLRDVWMMIRSF